jgi:hypothetical protein
VAGGTSFVRLDVINGDDFGCGISSFIVTAKVPLGWDYITGPNGPVSIFPGQNRNVTVIFAIPANAPDGIVPIFLTVRNIQSGKSVTIPWDFVVTSKPYIKDISPSSGIPGTPVIVTGGNFSTMFSADVYFNGQGLYIPLNPVTSTDGKTLHIRVPTQYEFREGQFMVPPPGIYNVSVRSGGSQTNEVPFTIFATSTPPATTTPPLGPPINSLKVIPNTYPNIWDLIQSWFK